MFVCVCVLNRFPGEGNGNPVQYSCLGNFMERGTWWATVHEVTKSWTRLGTHVFSDLYEILLGTEKQVSLSLVTRAQV